MWALHWRLRGCLQALWKVRNQTWFPLFPGFTPHLLQRWISRRKLNHKSAPVQVSAVNQALKSCFCVAQCIELDECKTPANVRMHIEFKIKVPGLRNLKTCDLQCRPFSSAAWQQKALQKSWILQSPPPLSPELTTQFLICAELLIPGRECSWQGAWCWAFLCLLCFLLSCRSCFLLSRTWWFKNEWF